MKTQHTPGPWKYKRTDGFDYGGTAYWIPGICTNLKNEEDARLIAAAPDLLEALKTIMAGVAGCQREPQWEAARAAIAKATGEA